MNDEYSIVHVSIENVPAYTEHGLGSQEPHRAVSDALSAMSEGEWHHSGYSTPCFDSTRRRGLSGGRGLVELLMTLDTEGSIVASVIFMNGQTMLECGIHFTVELP